MVRLPLSLVLLSAAAFPSARVVRAAAPAAPVNVTFKVYDRDQKVLAQTTTAVPRHTNGFDALRKTLAVDFETYANLGNFVTAICGVSQSPADGLFWILYVDGSTKPSSLGIGNFYVDKDMPIEFKLEKFQHNVAEGQRITATSHVTDAEGKVLRNQKVEFTARRNMLVK